jgi:uncharacterized GH25 family protein
MHGKRWRLAALAGLLATAAPCVALAHDSWLIADRNIVSPGETVRVAFVTGEEFPHGETATAPQRVAQWDCWGPDGRRKVTDYQIEGKELVARIRFDAPGVYLAAVRLHPNFISLKAADFVAYLRDEGAEAALRDREESDEHGARGRERYTKYAATYILVREPARAPAGAAPPPANTGEPRGRPGPAALKDLPGNAGPWAALTADFGLEVVPRNDPTRLRLGDELNLWVRRDGGLVSDVRVCAGREGLRPHEFVLVTRTDARHGVRIRLDQPGLWFARTHAIRRIGGSWDGKRPPSKAKPDGSAGGSGAAGDAETEPAGGMGRATEAPDWESYWASLTFRVAGAGEK